MKQFAVSSPLSAELLPHHVLDQASSVARTTAAPANQDFIPLALANLRSDQPYPFNIFVKTCTAGSPHINFALYCRRHETFTAAMWHKLADNGLDRIYLHLEEQKVATYYLIHHVSQHLEDPNLTPRDKTERLYDTSLLWLRQFYHEHKQQMQDSLQMGMTLVGNLLQHVFGDPSHQKWYLGVCRTDTMLYNHCLNCCLLGMGFARYLGWPPMKMRDLGLGALMHDFGMIKIPAAIRLKAGPLTPAEENQVRRHPRTGYAILKEYSALPRPALLVVLHHHENSDGSGYPQGLTRAMLDPMSRVMRIIDAYEAMTSPRSWRPTMPPIQALQTMSQAAQERSIFDRHYLHAFMQFLLRLSLAETSPLPPPPGQ